MTLRIRAAFVLGITSALQLAHSGAAHAMQLGEHRAMTRQAVDEFNLCMSGLVNAGMAEALVDSNISEDTNLFRKWMTHSHFFNPRKNLADMRRLDSSLRIVELEYQIEEALKRRRPDLRKAFELLGHAIHHFQDAASPGHAVPVMHGLDDGFESMQLTPAQMPDFDLSQRNCAQEKLRAKKDGLLAILDDTALATLDAIAAPLAAKRNGSPVRFSWADAFWKEASGNAFGSYGFLGNSFGNPTITVGSDRHEISREAYVAFKRARLRQATDATRRALHWMAALDWGSH